MFNNRRDPWHPFWGVRRYEETRRQPHPGPLRLPDIDDESSLEDESSFPPPNTPFPPPNHLERNLVRTRGNRVIIDRTDEINGPVPRDAPVPRTPPPRPLPLSHFSAGGFSEEKSEDPEARRHFGFLNGRRAEQEEMREDTDRPSPFAVTQ